MTGSDWLPLVEILDERRHLLAVATRYLGSDRYADEVVRRTYLSWFGLGTRDRSAVVAPREWLTRTAMRICADLAGAPPAHARDRRFAPRGAGENRGATVGAGEPDSSARLVRDFSAACRADRGSDLEKILAPSVTAVADGGGNVRISPTPVRGCVEVSRCLRILLARHPEITVAEQPVNGATGLVVHRGSTVVAVICPDVADHQIRHLWLVVNPDKLEGWNSA